MIKARSKLITLVLIMVMALVQIGCGEDKPNRISGNSISPRPSVKPITDATQNGKDITMSGVLSYINIDAKKLQFIDINSGVEYEVPYTNGTQISTANDRALAAANMEIGQIFDVKCDKSGKATSLKGNSEAWERNEVTGVEIDESSRRVSIGASELNFEPFTLAVSEDDRIPLSQVLSQDVVTLRGIGGKVYSINVNKGHGYISFSGIDTFVGGYVDLGDKQLFSVTKDMMVTAKEGTYTVTMQKGQTVGTRTVTVSRDEQTSLDFSDYTTAVAQKGVVNFSITPKEGILTIDGDETDWTSPISLTYGKHYITVDANHYEKYTETIVVNKAYQTLFIDLTANGSGTTASDTTVSNSNSSTTKSTTAKAGDLTNGYTVQINSPQGASLYVDSVYVGVVPCTFKKSAGSKTITLKQNGYNTISYTISIANAAGNLAYAFPDMVSADSKSTEKNSNTEISSSVDNNASQNIKETTTAASITKNTGTNGTTKKTTTKAATTKAATTKGGN